MRRTLPAVLMAALSTTLTVTVLTGPPAQAAVFDDRIQVLGDITVAEPRDDAAAGAALGRRFVFAGQQAGTGVELFITDGTRRGTKLIRDILPGSDDSYPNGFTLFKGRIWFQATGVGGAELWVTDGTAAGTKRVLDLASGAESGSPFGFTVAGDQMYFSAYTPATGRELWSTDGTAKNTTLVRDLWPGPTGSYPGGLTAFRERLVFTAQVEPEQEYPFVTDGTSARTYRLDDLDADLDVYDASFVVLGNVVLFAAQGNPDVGIELYRSRGARGDAVLVKDIEVGDSSFPQELTVLGGTVLFQAFDDDHGEELWRTDGTAAGTRLVKDIWPGTGDGDPQDLTRSGDLVYFRATTAAEADELWVTKGTGATTRLVRDLNVGDDSDAYPIGGLGGRMLLTAYRSGIGREFFTSNGTAPGTRLVQDFYPGADSVSGSFLGRSRGTFFFGLEPTGAPLAAAGPRLAAYTLPVPAVRPTPATSYSRVAAARREIRVRVGIRAPGIGVSGRVVLYRGTRVIGSAAIRDGVARVRITTRLGTGRHTLCARFLGSIDAQSRTSPSFVLRVR